MKSVREIYQKLREVKYHHLLKLYKKYLKKVPANCRYNYPYTINPGTKGSGTIRLCLLHQPDIDLTTGIFPHLVDICQESEHCISCNAFILRHTKDSIKNDFEEVLKNQKIKADIYPDICALEWALEKSVLETAPFPLLKKVYLNIKNMIKG